MNMSLPEKAMRLALRAHEGQVRKTDGSPYVIHPIMVALKLARHGFSDEVVAAALVHDVLEDTPVNEDELKQELGQEVLDIVTGVSEDKNLEWEMRKEAYAKQIGAGSDGVKAVSIGDKIHNLESVLRTYDEIGPTIWEKFNRGKEKKMWFEHLVLDALKEHWEHPLIAEYEALIKKADALSA